MLSQDLRQAVRSLIARPGFAAVAIVTLALGIGANTAIFGVVHAVLLRPLPYPGAERLVRVRGSSLRTRQPGNLSPMDFLDLRERTRRLERLAAYNNYADATLTGAGDPERLVGTRVTADFFGALGIVPQIGRDFRADDDMPDAPRVAILSYGAWRQRFAGDPSIVGRSIRLSGVPADVVGVLPPSFRHPFPDNARQPDVFVPFRLDRKENNRDGRYLQAIGRMRAGASVSDTERDLASIAADLAREHPASNTGESVTVVPILDSMTGSTRAPLLILLGLVALVLLIACANLANLLIARAVARHREIAIRRALGASRARLVRQFLVESVVLASAGGAAGLIVAAWTIRALAALGATRIPRGDGISLDLPVLLFTAGVSLATGLAFGIGPALYSTRADGDDGLKERGTAFDGHMHAGVHQALIVSEIALALMLLVSAGLFIKSFSRLEHVDPGFRADRVLTLQTMLPIARYPEGDEIPFYRRLEDRLRTIPGVRRVGAINILPLSGNYSCDGFEIAGRPPAPNGQQPCAENRSVTPGYFDAMGIPLVRGRRFSAQDAERSPAVVIISENMAQRFWPGHDSIGSRIVRNGKALEVVGIVGGVKHLSLDSDIPVQMYTPHAQPPSYHTMTIVVRSGGDAVSLTPLIRRELSALDAEVPIANVRPLQTVVDETTVEQRFRTVLIGAFAALAVLLAVVGVAGVISYAVGRRTREIGIRVALGATGGQIVALLIAQSMLPTALGLLVGIGGALALARLFAGLLFGVAVTDAAVFAAATALLTVAALAATYLPARRATAIDPIIALRAE